MKLTIIKVGGKVVEEPDSLNTLLDDFSAIAGNKILVHGGGRSATKLSERLGIEAKMVEGRRITDLETLNVVTMVYAGLVNKNIVAQLQKRKVNAIGFTGADLDIITSVKRPVKTIDYGFVEANTTAGKIGVKVWICHKEGMEEQDYAVNAKKNKVQKGAAR